MHLKLRPPETVLSEYFIYSNFVHNPNQCRNFHEFVRLSFQKMNETDNQVDKENWREKKKKGQNKIKMESQNCKPLLRECKAAVDSK